MINKVHTPEEAVAKMFDGMTVFICGFRDVGAPNGMVPYMLDAGLKDMTLIGIDAGSNKTAGFGRLVCAKRFKKLMVTHVGWNPDVTEQVNAGELELELIPQGTLAERIRCGGYGLGGFLTPTGVGTSVAEGKQVINMHGKDYLLEEPIRADVAVIKANKGDTAGNLVYHGCARNFNTVMAMAADFVVAEVDEIVPVGEIDPDDIVIPGCVVDMIVKP